METIEKIPVTQALTEYRLSIAKQGGEYLIRRGAAVETLVHGCDYGPPWPGSKLDTLLLPGAEKVNAIMGVYAEPELKEKIIDLEKGFFYFCYQIKLINKVTGAIEAVAQGSCNSWEDKFRYRAAKRKCPVCGSEALFKSKFPDKVTKDKGYYCWSKEGGCGAQFLSTTPEIVNQEVGKVLHPNPANEMATVQAIAIKRPHVKATRLLACLSGIFDQPDEPETVDERTGEIIETKVVDGAVPTPAPIKESWKSVPVREDDMPNDPTYPPDDSQATSQERTNPEGMLLKSELRRSLMEVCSKDSTKTLDSALQFFLGNEKAMYTHIERASSPKQMETLKKALHVSKEWLKSWTMKAGGVVA